MDMKKTGHIFLGSDHAGYALKEKIKGWLKDWDRPFQDMGPFSHDMDDDYPDIIEKVARKVSETGGAKGIVLGHSGQGEAIVANKFKGVRAAVYYGGPEEIISLSRQHNDANILSLGASFLDEAAARQVISLWLDTEFSGETRHRRRLEKIAKIEKD